MTTDQGRDMSAPFPDVGTIRTALSLATRAPSTRNSQPWRWRIGADSLHLYANPARHPQDADLARHDLIVSCGAALNHCATGLAALGWQPTIHRFPDPADNSHLAVIEVAPYLASGPDVALAAAIPRRRTDRRHYSAWPVAHGYIALMGARAARAGIALRRVEISPALRAAVAQAIWPHVSDLDYSGESAAGSGRGTSPAGAPALDTPESDPAAALSGRCSGDPALAQPPETTAEDDDAVLIALGTSVDDDLARLRAGEATSIVLLTATALGLASCLASQPLEIPEIRDAIREDVFGSTGFPQMLLRVGWAPFNADPLPATPRRELSDVVDRLDGAPIT